MSAAPCDPLLENRDWHRLRAWYGLRGRHGLPWRRARSPWRVLLAETLLHRTRADTVARVYPAASSGFPSPKAVVDRPELWRELTRPLGLSWRAETFIAACSELVREHAGRVPDERAALERLPGIGHYSANAVICFGFGRNAALVDTNTIRLAARISGERLDPSRHRSRAVREAVARLRPDGQPPVRTTTSRFWTWPRWSVHRAHRSVRYALSQRVALPGDLFCTGRGGDLRIDGRRGQVRHKTGQVAGPDAACPPAVLRA